MAEMTVQVDCIVVSDCAMKKTIQARVSECIVLHVLCVLLQRCGSGSENSHSANAESAASACRLISVIRAMTSAS